MRIWLVGLVQLLSVVSVSFSGSTQETVRMRILRGFLKSDEFGLGERQPLRL